jgi:hypothetical protein
MLVTTPAAAQYGLGWFTIDGGGTTTSSGGPYTLRGTIGQPDAGLLSGGANVVAGGFWTGGSVDVVAVEQQPDRHLSFRLHGAVPNPVVHSTVIAFDLPKARPTRLCVYDVTGRLVRMLAEGMFQAGSHERRWDRTDDAGRLVTAGVFFVLIDAGGDRVRRKIVVL